MKLALRNIAITTGGTENILVSGQSGDPLYEGFRLTGSETLSSNYILAPSGTPATNQVVRFYSEANFTLSGNSVVIFGATLPTSFALKNFVAECVYGGAAWVVSFYPSWSEDGFIMTADIEDLAVTTGKINDLAVTTGKIAAEAVTNAKLAQMATVTIKGNDGAGPAVPQDLTMEEVRTILDQDVTLTGDVTGTATQTFATGVTTVATTIANDAVTTAKIAANQVTNAKMADDSITLTNLASTGELESLTTSSPTPNSTALTVLASLAIPTGAMDTAGDVLEITAYGTTGATANNKTLTLVLGTTVLATNSTTAAPNNLNWTIEAKIFYTGAAAQKGYCKFTFNGVASEIDVFTGAETWLANTVYIKGQNGTAAVGEITLEGFQAINHKKNNN